MAIHVECPECDRAYDVPDRYAGRKVRCKSCGGAIPVPQAAVATDDAALDEPFPAMTPRRQPARRAVTTATASPLAGPEKWWLIGGAAVVLLATLAVSFLTPLGLLIAVGLFVIGMLVLTVGQIMLIVTAFNEDASQGLLVFFVPIYPLFYLISRWPKTSMSVWLYAAGITVSLLSIPTGFGGMFATAQWAASVDAPDDPADGTVVAGGGGAVGGDAAGMPDGNPFAPPPDFMPPGEMPPGFMPPGFMPPGGMPPGGMPPAGFPQAHGFPPAQGFPPAAMPDGFRADGDSTDFDGMPVATSLYLRGTTSSFDRNADHTADVESQLAGVEGYVAGSAVIDMRQGVVTFEASPHAANQVAEILRRMGLRASPHPSPQPWVDPTRPITVSLAIRSTLPAFDDLKDVDGTVDELLSELDGYVPGSVAVDVDAGEVSYEAYADSRAARFPLAVLLRAGIHTAPPGR